MEKCVSVIVPIYKVEPYLKRAVDSIINQTYSKLEIILVDDGSPDNCGKICDDYAKRDNRIKVIHKENGGLSDARNAGLDIATGEYIAFVDSDDYIAEDFVETLLWNWRSMMQMFPCVPTGSRPLWNLMTVYGENTWMRVSRSVTGGSFIQSV